MRTLVRALTDDPQICCKSATLRPILTKLRYRVPHFLRTWPKSTPVVHVLSGGLRLSDGVRSSHLHITPELLRSQGARQRRAGEGGGLSGGKRRAESLGTGALTDETYPIRGRSRRGYVCGSPGP